MGKKKTALIVIMIIIVVWFGIRLSRDRSECDTWRYYRSSGKTVSSVEEAIEVFREFLPSEEKFKDHQLPTTLEGFKEKYNTVPFIKEEKVTTKDGYIEMKRVYDMLLAYVISDEGDIYKYNMCGYI